MGDCLGESLDISCRLPGKPWQVLGIILGGFAKYVKDLGQSLEALGRRASLAKCLGQQWPNPGCILERLPWGVGGKSCRVFWGIMAKFSGAFLCDCMGESCQKSCTTLGGPGQLLAAFLGDCFGEVLQESRKLLGEPWQAPWEILERFFFFKIFERPWPRVVGILGRLPWKGLWQVLQNALGDQGQNPRGILERLPWGILQGVMQIAWGTLAGSLKDSGKVCKIL